MTVTTTGGLKTPNAIGVERWAGAVKTAYEYIKSNYTVSAGNYFRKDAEGNAGDNVSSYIWW